MAVVARLVAEVADVDLKRGYSPSSQWSEISVRQRALKWALELFYRLAKHPNPRNLP